MEILGKERRRKECKSKKQRKVEYSGNVRNKEKKNRVEMWETERSRIEWKCKKHREVEYSGNVRNKEK